MAQIVGLEIMPLGSTMVMLMTLQGELPSRSGGLKVLRWEISQGLRSGFASARGAARKPPKVNEMMLERCILKRP